MKTKIAVAIAVLLCVLQCKATIVELFQDTDKYIDRASDIVIAKCVAVPQPPAHVALPDGVHEVEVDVKQVLKGNCKTGPLTIAVLHDLQPGEMYLLASRDGGSFKGVEFLCIVEMSAVPIPSYFDLATIKDKPLKEQLQKIFSVHLYEVEQKLRPLLEEKERLERALKDRTDDRFESSGDVHLHDAKELAITAIDMDRYFILPPGKLGWSHSNPGKSGFLYYNHGESDPHWEFAKTDRTSIESLEGKPLSAKFTGQYSPGSNGNSMMVAVGEVVLARSRAEPNTVYILDLVSQDANKELATIIWASVPNKDINLPSKDK